MRVFKVSEFIDFLNEALAAAAPRDEVAVEGEVASFNIAQNQWVRFDLKDETALLNCFLTVWQLRVPIEDGMKIRVRGFPKIYPRYGKLSLVVHHIELVGEGALKKAFEMLKKKLAAEGFFEVSRKRPLPRFPSRIALITSPGAAAYTDFLRILNNRWRGVTVDLLPVAVQGVGAVDQITGAFRWLNEHCAYYDICVLTRGGGSLEDLQAFNSEAVARAIYASKVPVVCGVGHERDETLADYVADVRASTPSNAAELVVPDYREVLRNISSHCLTIASALSRRLMQTEDFLNESVWRLRSFITQKEQLFSKLFLNLRSHFLVFHQKFTQHREAALASKARLSFAAANLLSAVSLRLQKEERLLKSLDPQAVLKRGFSIVFNQEGKVVKNAAQVDKGELIKIKLKEGGLLSEVKEKNQDA